jgi:hypothetical protein
MAASSDVCEKELRGVTSLSAGCTFAPFIFCRMPCVLLELNMSIAVTGCLKIMAPHLQDASFAPLVYHCASPRNYRIRSNEIDHTI